MIPRTAAGEFKPGTLIAFVVMHLAALLVFHPYFFSWEGVGAFLFTMWLSASLGISALYHRALTHGSWKPKVPLMNVLGILSALTLEMGPLKWAAYHREHHQESDHVNDPHSPLVPEIGFWWAHLLWMLYTHKELDKPGVVEERVRDLMKYPFLVWLERNFAYCWLAFTALLFGIGYLAGGLQLGLSVALWGGIFRTVVVWHNTWFVNSATHLWGYRNHKTGDDSRNLWWVAWLTFGEGWHNNHHAIAGRARFGEKWWEFDPTWWALKVFQWLGWTERVTDGGRTSSAGKMPAKSEAHQSRAKDRLEAEPALTN